MSSGSPSRPATPAWMFAAVGGAALLFVAVVAWAAWPSRPAHRVPQPAVAQVSPDVEQPKQTQQKPPQPPPEPPADPLQGVWQQTNGSRAWRFEIRGDRLIQTGVSGPEEYAYKITSPGRIFWSNKDGSLPTYGLFKIEGDQLTLCHSFRGYPERFESDLGERSIHLWEFRRVK